ncbi:MAG: hypothetical protein ABSG94_05615 [Brevinematales bacterium]
MAISIQNNDITTAQKQKQEMEAIEQRRAAQSEEDARARKQEEAKPPDQKPTMLKEKTGSMVDIKA